MRRVIFNQKGGVGKSTITCNLAATSVADGKRVLVVDLDPQGNASHYLLGSKINEIETTIADFFQELLYSFFHNANPAKWIHTTQFEGLDIMPSHPDLEDLQTKLESRYKMFKLKEILEKLTDYDYIYIDTPPAFNFYTRSALIACNSCLIPFDCDDFSRKALYKLLDNVNEIRYDHNPDLQVEGIVVNQFQSRANLPKKIVAELISEGLPVLDTYLSSSIRIRESHEKAMPMAFFDPRHKLTGEFFKLYQKINT